MYNTRYSLPLHMLIFFGVGNGMPKDPLDTSLDIIRKKLLQSFFIEA